MALRKCPGCKNIIAAETESCPICGCNPRTRRFRKFLFWGAAVAVTPGQGAAVLAEPDPLPAVAPARPMPAPATVDTSRLAALSPREVEVLRLVATGMSYKEIAAELFLSHRTVQNHVQNTLRKLQMHNRVELTRYAIERGLDGEPIAVWLYAEHLTRV